MNKSDLFYEIANEQYKEQDARRRHFDTMSTGILALSGALVGVLIFSDADWACWSIIPVIFVMLGFVGVAISTIFSLWLREWHCQPPLSDLYENIESGEYKDDKLIIWSGKQIMSAVENNEKPLRSKAFWVKMTHLFLIAEVLALGVFVLSVSA